MMQVVLLHTLSLGLYGFLLLVEAVQALLFLAGFGAGLGGPRRVRSMAAGGFLATVVQAGFTTVLVVAAYTMLRGIDMGDTEIDPITPGLLMLSAINSIFGASELPWIVILVGTDRIHKNWHVLFIVVNASLEFLRLSFLCILSQSYAAEAKSPETGHKALRLIYQMIWAVLIGVFFKPLFFWVVLVFVIASLTTPVLMFRVFLIVPWAMVNGYMMWWVMLWLLQAATCRDILDILTPHRLAEKRENLDGLP
jgi:hypothetical protein